MVEQASTSSDQSTASQRVGTIFEPLAFRNLTVKNRIFRSNIGGRFDDYNGRGREARIEWELKFARGGVGAILSAFSSVDVRGRIVPSYASIDRDSTIPFWRELGERVHEHDCRYIIQLAHGGRQRDIPGIEFGRGLSSTNRSDPLQGFPTERMSVAQIEAATGAFGRAAGRAREAGLDGVEIHGANGYLFTQFLSSAINDRKDSYGGSLENRARLLVETVRAIRSRVGDDFHLQVKISATEGANAFLFWLGRGNTVDDAVEVARWLEEAGADAIHVSAGSTFPHPLNPRGGLPLKTVRDNYDGLISSGRHAFRNYLLYRVPVVNSIMKRRWERPHDQIEGASLADARAVKAAVSIPVLVTGGFQTASVVRGALIAGDCDAVTIARPLIANADLLAQWRAGRDRPERPCTYCNYCLYNLLENPLACWDERRFESREQMVAEAFSVYDPPPFGAEAP